MAKSKDSGSSKDEKNKEKAEKAAKKEAMKAEKQAKKDAEKKAKADKKDEKKLRMQRNMERMQLLARPNSRRLRSLWDEKCAILSRERRDKIKSALEEDYFLSPEQTEQYFQAFYSSKRWCPATAEGAVTHNEAAKKEDLEKAKEMRHRQKWLVNFSAQYMVRWDDLRIEVGVAYRLCDYIAKGGKEMLVSNRLRSIADVVLERVAEILGEPKPARANPGRVQRFMVAISDRIAVWIEKSVYQAEALEEPPSHYTSDEHIRLDPKKSYY